MADRERFALTAFIATSVLAGGNAVGVRFSNRELAPLWGAGLRFSLAAVILRGIMGARRLPLPRGKALAGAFLFGLINFGFTFALAYYALVRLHAGLGQTLLALVPLATLLLAVAQRQERLRPTSIVGTLLALAGVAVISGASFGESLPLLSLIAAMGAVLCFAEAAGRWRASWTGWVVSQGSSVSTSEGRACPIRFLWARCRRWSSGWTTPAWSWTLRVPTKPP